MYNKGIESGDHMRKLLFKKILSILDSIEIQGITLQNTPEKLQEELIKSNYSVKLAELKEIVQFLKQKKLLKVTKNGIDLTPAATIYSKSNQNSALEALAIFESFLLESTIVSFYLQQIKHNDMVLKKEVRTFIDEESLQFLLQTNLFEVEKDKMHFHPRLLQGIKDILEEYREDTPLVSITLTALYTSTIVAHEDLHVNYKNTKSSMVNYRFKKVILSFIPRVGIPQDRDETKALQSFYKDTLFHEFYHACPICNINIAHMLIASHIKPFRDCAHIFEAIDHNNGLLLCRNHDYLFDQGYITFDDQGYIILSKEMLHYKNLEASYALHKNFRLPPQFMTENRKLFMMYHRECIFKK